VSLLDLLPGIKSAVVGPIRTVILQLRTAIDTLTHVFDTCQGILDDSVGIWTELKNFELKPHWHTRALSVPDAIDNVKDLAEVPGKIFIAVKDLWSRLKSKVATPSQQAADEAVAAIEEAGTVEGFLIRVFPRLARLIGKAIAKILAIVGFVVEGLIDASNALADIRTLVGQFRVAIESLNHLDAVFLRQNKKRKTLRLEDGSTIRIRIPRRHGET